MKKTKKNNLKINRILLVLFILCLVLYLCIRFSMSLIHDYITEGTGSNIADIASTFNQEPKYKIIKEDTNSNYAGKRSRKER